MSLVSNKPRRQKRDRDLFGKLIPLEPQRSNEEDHRQASIVSYVRWVAPHLRIFHVPNGGVRDKATAAKLKWIGVLKGVLDLVVLLPGGRSAFWECKRPKGGRLSDDQKDMIEWLMANGHAWAVVLSIDDARRELEKLGVETREAQPV